MQIIIPFVLNTLPIKNQAFKIRFSLKVKHHGQKQLYLQYKVCWTLNKMVGALSLSKLYLRV